MPRYMLDTNMVIYLMKHQPKEVAEKFSKCFAGDVVMSAITYAELQYGVSVSADPDCERANLKDLIGDIPVAPFDAHAAEAYVPIREATRERKKDHLDKLIAAQAVAIDVVLVTNNERDFLHYPGIKLENWLTI
jgi:tRNA(fMet)-specific endonuclease VapC